MLGTLWGEKDHVLVVAGGGRDDDLVLGRVHVHGHENEGDGDGFGFDRPFQCGRTVEVVHQKETSTFCPRTSS